MKNKIFIIVILSLLFQGIVMAQPTVQAGIFSSGNTITIKAKPDSNLNDNLTAVKISIRYAQSYNVTISNLVSYAPLTFVLDSAFSDLTYQYRVYSAFNALGFTPAINWTAGGEYNLLSIDISGGTGSGIFFLINLPTPDEYYFEGLFNYDVTNYAVPFYQESTESPLPIQLTYFSHNVMKNNIKLNWKTSKETNNKEFIVERKNVNAEGWNIAGAIDGKGNTNTISEYSFSDNNLQTGKYNYRLKQVDYNGNFEYHNLNGVVEVGVPDKFELSQNYPNPFNPTTKIDFDLPFDSKVHIVLFDITGREVKTLVNETRTAGYYTININASDLSSGVYFYRILTKSAGKDFVMTKKMALIK